MEKFGETWKCKRQDESWGLKQSWRFSWEIVGFLQVKLEQDRKFRSKDLQEQNNER